MKKGQQKSSKRKQKLYDKYLKKRTKQINEACKHYKSLFEPAKKNSKTLYSSKLIENAKII